MANSLFSERKASLAIKAFYIQYRFGNLKQKLRSTQWSLIFPLCTVAHCTGLQHPSCCCLCICDTIPAVRDGSSTTLPYFPVLANDDSDDKSSMLAMCVCTIQVPSQISKNRKSLLRLSHNCTQHRHHRLVFEFVQVIFVF